MVPPAANSPALATPEHDEPCVAEALLIAFKPCGGGLASDVSLLHGGAAQSLARGVTPTSCGLAFVLLRVFAHWEACGDQRLNYRGQPKRSTSPVATPRHQSLYIFTRLVHQHFWPVKKEQYMALAGEAESAIYRARSA